MYAAILLAAGTSLRMGAENKLLLPFHGKSLVRYVAEQLSASSVGEVIAVLGYEASRVEQALEGCPLRAVLNERYETGMTSSIQAGVAALPPGCEAFLICLADMPWLTAAHYDALIAFFREKKKTGGAPIVRPSDGNRPGHPVIYDASYIPAMLGCQGPEGCREVILNNKDRLFTYPSSDDAFYRDIDLPGDW